jgi:hypothetical protein
VAVTAATWQHCLFQQFFSVANFFQNFLKIRPLGKKIRPHMKNCFVKKNNAENLQIVEEYEYKVRIKMHSSLKIHKISQRQEF